MKSICLLIVFVSFSLGCLCQLRIKGKILGEPVAGNHIFLYEVHKFSDRGRLLDSISVSSDGNFDYSVPGNYIPGTLFKITGKHKPYTFEFPENSLLFTYEKNSSISILIKSFSHLYLAEYTSASRANITVSKLQQLQLSYFDLVNTYLASKQGPGDRDAFITDMEKDKASFLQQLQQFSNKESMPLINLAILYFYCNINSGQLNNPLSIAKFEHLELPATALAESLKKELAMQSINAFDKAISTYALLDSNRNEIALPALFKAKYTVVDLWASWCMPCRKENKNEVPGFIEKLKLYDVDFIALSVDTDLAKWERAVRDDNIGWKSFLLKNEEKKGLPEILNGNGIPYYLIYNQQGKAIYGSRSSFQVYSYLQKLN